MGFSFFVDQNPGFPCFPFIFLFGIKIVQERVKKSWTVVDARTLKKEDLQKETIYCLNDDNETEVPKEDTIQGEPVRELLQGGGRQTRIYAGWQCWQMFS